MSTVNLNASVISEKVSKIRWIPEQYRTPQSFVTGNWDFATNNLRIWTYIQNDPTDEEIEFIPKSTAKVNVDGDVTGIEFVNLDNLLVSSSDGLVSLFNINRDLAANNLFRKHTFDGLHKFQGNNTAPCTDLSVYGNSVATVGEDGRLNIVNLNGMSVARSFEEADSCSIISVAFINQKEILTGNRMGLIKIFDSLSDNEKPMTTLMASCENDKKSNAVTAIAYHPTQTHIVLSGCEEGSITVWDLRQPEYPASYLSAHETAITEIGFHPTEPVKVYTSSEGGELYQWTSDSNQFSIDSMEGQSNLPKHENINPWLSGERAKNSISALRSGEDGHKVQCFEEKSDEIEINEECKEESPKLKTFGDIKVSYQKYSESGSNKKLVKNYHSIINLPLFDESEEMPVIEKVVIPELHEIQGIVNHIFFDGLVPILGRENAFKWPNKMHLTTKNYQGEKFEGNACRRLLKEADNLNDHEILQGTSIFKIIPFIQTLKSMDKLVDACFSSRRLDSKWKLYLKEFEQNYRATGISITLKVHVLFDHLGHGLHFLDGDSLGLWSEQAGESVHRIFMKYWAKYQINDLNSENYCKQLKKAVVEFSSRNL